MARMKEKYDKEIAPAICSEFSLKNKMSAPILDKICINIGMGQAKNEAKRFEKAQGVLAKITGQRPVVTKATKSVSNFKLREGDAVGCRVTLRKERMFEFLDRLINTALPRVRDFRGLPTKSFDKAGNYSFGVVEQSIFPELSISDLEQEFGMDITLCFKNSDREKSTSVMKHFDFPFKK